MSKGTSSAADCRMAADELALRLNNLLAWYGLYLANGLGCWADVIQDMVPELAVAMESHIPRLDSMPVLRMKAAAESADPAHVYPSWEWERDKPKLQHLVICLRLDAVDASPSETQDNGPTKADAKGSPPWWCEDDPPIDGKYRWGPLEGCGSQLARWANVPYRTFKGRNRKQFWIRRIGGKKCRVWFSVEKDYSLAHRNCIGEQQKPCPKQRSK